MSVKNDKHNHTGKQFFIFQSNGRVALVESEGPLKGFSEWLIYGEYIRDNKPQRKSYYLIPTKLLEKAKQAGAVLCRTEKAG